MVVAWVWVENGMYCLMGIASTQEDEVLEPDGSDGCTTMGMNVLNITELYT